MLIILHVQGYGITKNYFVSISESVIDI